MSFLFLVPLISRLLGSNATPGRAEGLAKVAGWILVALLAVALLAVGKCSYDHSIIQAHTDKVAAKVATATLSSERAANTNSDQRQAVQEAETAATNQEIHDAVQAHPVEAHQSVGPATGAAVDRLRQRRH